MSKSGYEINGLTWTGVSVSMSLRVRVCVCECGHWPIGSLVVLL